MVSDLMHVPNFNCQTVDGVKMLLFFLCMLIIEKKDILVLVEDSLDDAAITARGKYLV